MNKISLYVLLILIFLGLSKSFSPSEQRTPYLANEQVYSDFFFGAPLSIILVDSFKTGFLIKTYFHRYKIVHGFKIPEEIVVRTSKKFWDKNLPNKGLSLFRRKEVLFEEPGKKEAKQKYVSELEQGHEESTVPMPPGILYVGDHAYGRWRLIDSGEKVWTFHRAYRHFPKIFKWGGFRPTQDFQKTAEVYTTQDRPFYGLNNEFGTNGEITKEEFKDTLNTDEHKIEFIKHILSLFSIPPWENKNE